MINRQNDIDDETLLHLHFASDPESVGGAVERTMTAFAALQLSDDDQSTTELVLVEAINNIVEHAYQERPDGPIELILIRSHSHIRCGLTDKGIPMPEEQPPTPTQHNLDCAIADLPEGGFGWNIIHELGQNVQYCRQNGENHLFFDLYFSDLATGG